MPHSELVSLRDDARQLADPEVAAHFKRFFKTGPGQYGEGDRFLGIRVPPLRRLASVHRDLPLEQTIELLQSEWHEERLLALLLLVERYRRGDEDERRRVYDAYLAHTHRINNWDLVDSSAEFIVGPHLNLDDLAILDTLAGSDVLWERRIAMLATFHWIKQGIHQPALRIAHALVHDSHDLIHKAVGWMLREVGKRDLAMEEAFLGEHYRTMPRTMLRYAIERFPEPRRQGYLRGDV